jgi:hypothetical protein
MKKCNKCLQFLDSNCFYKKKGTFDGLDCLCKNCSKVYHQQYYKKNIIKERQKRKERSRFYRKHYPNKIQNWKLKARYGISLDEKNEMVKKQNYKCAICGSDITQKACVDHNHETDKVRELLCDSCNTGIGMFKENIQVMQKAIDYLIKHNI